MDPKLLAILKKSKAVEQATNQIYGGTGSGGEKRKPTNGGGLYDQLDGTGLLTAEQAGMGTTVSAVERADVTSDNYTTLVTNSKLPAAIAQAMIKNPIPQPNMVSSVDEDTIRELNPNYGKKEVYEEYSEEDEHDYLTEQRHETKPVRQQSVVRQTSGISEGQIRKLIAKEIARVLPKVVENYFDRELVKENTRVMKYMIKTQGRKTIK